MIALEYNRSSSARYREAVTQILREFGDDIAGELVDWFNAVDLTYQTQLRELNELNWERFKATLQAEIATLRGELRTEISGLRGELRTDMSEANQGLHKEISATRTELIKWMFVFWCGNMIGLGGLIVGLLGLR